MRSMILVAAAAIFAGQAHAQAGPAGGRHIDIREMYFVHGTCTRLVLPEGDRTANCNGAVGHILYASGRTSFWFSIPGEALISFSGLKDTSTDGNGSLELDLVTVATSPKVPVSESHGTCVFENPWRGVAHFRCHGRNEAGEVVAEFTTDGKPPEKVGE